MQDSLNSLKVEADDTSPKALKWYQWCCHEDGCFPRQQEDQTPKGSISSEGTDADAPPVKRLKKEFDKTSLEEGGDSVKVHQLFCASSAGQLSINFHKCFNDFVCPNIRFCGVSRPTGLKTLKSLKVLSVWTE